VAIAGKRCGWYARTELRTGGRLAKGNGMSEHDPAIWKTIVDWIWIAPTALVGHVWRKVSTSASKEELREAMHDAKDDRAQIKSMVKTLFSSAEDDRRRYDERFQTVLERMHEIHLDLRDRIEKK